MSDQADVPQEKPAKRGEARWKETVEAVAQKNAAAQKKGRAQREAYELGRVAKRRAAERDEMAKISAKRPTKRSS